MKHAQSLPVLVVLATGLSAALHAEPALAAEVSLSEVLAQTEKSDPSIEASRAVEKAVRASVGIAKAGYLPTVQAQAIDSLGFPGSTGYLGIGGVMGSSYRSGLGAGFVATQRVYDFGLTDADVQVAEKDSTAQAQRTRLQAQKAQLAGLHAYVACALQRSQVKLLGSLRKNAETVAREVTKFVKTGQRSIVDKYLANTQLEETLTSEAVAETRLTEAEKALTLVMGLAPGTRITCPLLDVRPRWQGKDAPVEQNPYVAAEIAALDTERTRKEAVRAKYMPKIDALGSVGLMERSRVVPKNFYAVGVGIKVPLFDGFKDDYELERSDALIASHESQVAARKLELAESNARYDELIAAARTRLEHLNREVKVAGEAFKVAKQRYFDSQGTLTDLREALRNLRSAQVQVNEALASEMDAVGSRALVNGDRLTEGR